MSDVHSSPDYTGRSLNTILNFHGLSAEQFEGARVADLGCGRSNLAGDLANQGIDATVIGIDINPIMLQTGRTKSPLQHQVLANLGALPIASQSIDIALATFSIPFWAVSKEAIDAFFNEAERITTLGGLLSVYPLQIDNATSEFPALYLDARFRAMAMKRSVSWQSNDRYFDDKLSVTRLSTKDLPELEPVWHV